MKTQVIIEKGADGSYSVYPESLSTMIIGEGATPEEAKKDFLNSYQEILQYYSDNGMALPKELKDLEFSYKYDLAAFFNCFKFINVSKFAESIGIEPSLMRHYKAGKTSISKAQIERIENGIHSLARELQEIRL